MVDYYLDFENPLKEIDQKIELIGGMRHLTTNPASRNSAKSEDS